MKDDCGCGVDAPVSCKFTECHKKGQVRYWGKKRYGDRIDYVKSKETLRKLTEKAEREEERRGRKETILRCRNMKNAAYMERYKR